MIIKSKFLQNAKQESFNTNFKQLEPKKSSDFFMHSYYSKIWELREAHRKSLNEMEELRKFQSSAFDTMARRKFIEDQKTFFGTFWPSTGIAK